MRTRASQIDGKLDIQTAAGHGTSIVLIVPIPLWNRLLHLERELQVLQYMALGISAALNGTSPRRASLMSGVSRPMPV